MNSFKFEHMTFIKNLLLFDISWTTHQKSSFIRERTHRKNNNGGLRRKSNEAIKEEVPYLMKSTVSVVVARYQETEDVRSLLERSRPEMNANTALMLQ